MAATSMDIQPKTYLSKCFDIIFSLSDLPPLIFQAAYPFTDPYNGKENHPIGI
jgi:hypothetical protein